MKLVLYQIGGNGVALPGLLTDRGVVSIASAVKIGYRIAAYGSCLR